MKSPWVTLAAVLIVALAAGAAIAGRPSPPANDIRIVAVPATTTTADPTTTTVAPTPSTAPSSADTTTTEIEATTTVAATTAPSTTTVATTTTVETNPVPDRSKVLVLVANAGKASGIARAEAARLADLGYPPPVTDDAINRLDLTTAYARIGHEDEALQVLADAGLADDRLRPFPSENAPITTLDFKANVILALGFDWHA